MRQVIGAYGTAVTFNEDLLSLSTYRDPSLAEAYQVFEQTGAAVSGLELTQEVIDGYIMSAYSAAAKPNGSLTGAAGAIIDHMAGKDTAWRLEELRDEDCHPCRCPGYGRCSDQGGRNRGTLNLRRSCRH